MYAHKCLYASCYTVASFRIFFLKSHRQSQSSFTLVTRRCSTGSLLKAEILNALSEHKLSSLASSHGKFPQPPPGWVHPEPLRLHLCSLLWRLNPPPAFCRWPQTTGNPHQPHKWNPPHLFSPLIQTSQKQHQHSMLTPSYLLLLLNPPQFCFFFFFLWKWSRTRLAPTITSNNTWPCLSFFLFFLLGSDMFAPYRPKVLVHFSFHPTTDSHMYRYPSASGYYCLEVP